jgi:hypothetical protein
MGCDMIIGAIFYRLLYIAVHDDRDFHLICSFRPLIALALTVALALLLLVLLSFDFFIALSDGGRAFSSS